jgi:hypothetical protein
MQRENTGSCQHFDRLFCSIIFSFLILSLWSCTEHTTTPENVATRQANLGFTYYPYDGNGTGVQFAVDVIAHKADMLVVHIDNGIPWDAAFANNYDQYPQDLQDEISLITFAKPAGHSLYVATTPIAFLRNRLAPTLLANGQQSFQAPWNTYSFDHPDVNQAYINHCRLLISRYQPDYFAFGIEVNLLYELGSDTLWNQYLTLARTVYDSLKVTSPSLPLLQTIQAESYYRNTVLGSTLISQLLPTTDILGISVYSYAEYSRYPGESTADPMQLPSTYFSTLGALAQGKPIAITETAWPGEDITTPYPITIHSGVGEQQAYINFLLSSIDKLNTKFVCWFFTRDYDQFWNSTLKSDPNASLIRCWKDTGMYDSTGTARPALAVWLEYLNRKKQ